MKINGKFSALNESINLPQFLLCVIKAFCKVINWLVLSDGIFLNARLVWVKIANLRFVAHTILMMMEHSKMEIY